MALPLQFTRGVSSKASQNLYIPLFSDREMITLSFWPACLLKIQLRGREHLVLSPHQRGFGETPQPHTPPALGFSGPPRSCTTPSSGAETGPLLHNPVLPTRTFRLGAMLGQCPPCWHAPHPLRHLAWRLSVIPGQLFALTLHQLWGFLVRLLVARLPLLVLKLVLFYTIQCCQREQFC